MRQRKRMTGVLFLVVIVLGCSALNVRASEPDPKFFNPAQEKRIKQLEDRLSILEAAMLPQPKPEQMPAPRIATPKSAMKAGPATNAVGAVIDPAPVGKVWMKAGALDSDAPWELKDVAPSQAVTSPAQSVTFPTPIRSGFYNLTGVVVGGSTCPGGQCRYQSQYTTPQYAR